MKDASSPTENLLDELIKHTKGVRFAIVIITADDIGRAKGQPEEQSRYRGRQNVIFEFGYLIHQLSKSKVFVLHGQDVELPSDYSGIIYIPYDQPGAWQLQLAKAIKNASIPGIAVNLNSLFR